MPITWFQTHSPVYDKENCFACIHNFPVRFTCTHSKHSRNVQNPFTQVGQDSSWNPDTYPKCISTPFSMPSQRNLNHKIQLWQKSPSHAFNQLDRTVWHHSLLDALVVLQLGDDSDVLPLLPQDVAYLLHTRSAADERCKNHVHLK